MKSIRGFHGRIAIAMLLSLGVATSALALEGRRHGGPGGGGQFWGGGGVLQEVIHPCQAACFADARGCRDAARATAVKCVSSTCSAQITTARSACLPTSTMQACHSAVEGLKTCGGTCLDTLHSSVGACHDTLATCRAACSPGQ